MLENVGIPTLGVDIRLIAQTGQDQCAAILKAEDPLFAKTACTRLATYTTLPDMKVVVVPPIMPHSQSPCQIDCRKVHCAWSRPTIEARLTFGTKSHAVKLSKAGNYKGPGSKITTQVQQIPDGWMVKLIGLGVTVSEQDIINTIPISERPLKVELGEPSYVVDSEFDTTIIKSMLLESGPLERWEVSSNSKSKRFNAYGTFLDESSASDAASTLNNKPLSFSKTTRLSVSVVASAKFKIPTKIYGMVRPRITAQKQIWDRQYIQFSEFPSKGQYQVLKLEGDNHQLVVQAKEYIEKIVKGDIVRMEGKDLRCGNFRKDGKEFKKVQVIEDTFNVLIVPDIRKSQFRILGRKAVPKDTLESITKMLQDCISESHVIELDELDFRWATSGGFRLLRSQLGSGIACLDITSRYKRILIRGSKADYNNAMTIIATRRVLPRDTDSRPGMECPTCFCEPDEPIRMSCDHVYCSDCFVQMCVAEMTTTGEFLICCPKTNSYGGVCNQAFSLSEIQEHLPSETFDDVLTKSFESYIVRHPADFTYCPTPDCDQVYRITSHDSEYPNIFTCKKCLKSTCTTCQASHPGKPCSKAKLSNALSDKMKEELGIKGCPRCSRLIEKTDGCNHITCKCGAHVCWVCLAPFEVPAECYDHMRRIHGGIGI
ncbi:uncharacterized protein TRIVIDRAFT_171001 [Trichoderma virens Gv29-8]|uniref:RING-type domain-containing protein n=1 Tax=Hypocrea virens (strain Gv29-8 / FGSC 10586) TaxID=413071 RepID=G9MX51_HYPVG|nr:uncharacterized protein TRIVIDRAFT_171001 [Trichoderma virens Gv29-8]EHK20984.1 hypothetical protein TRIVIDRAFT_171001 [Trichoderma virens Gv29-8]